MISVRLRAFGVCVLLVTASCDSTSDTGDGVQAPVPAFSSAASSSTTTTVPERWAHEARLFFDAFHLAQAGRRGAHLGGFYAPSAVYENRMAGLVLEGREAISQFPAPLLASPPVTRLLFVTTDRAATTTNPDPMVAETFLPLTDLEVFHMSDGRIGYETREAPLLELVRAGFVTRDRTARVGALYEEYVTAWESGDRQRIEAVYRAGATRRDGLFGGTSVIGEDWAESLPPHLGMTAEGVRYDPVFAPFRPNEPRVAAAVFTVPTNDDPISAHVLFDLSNGEGCRLRLLAAWELDDFLITGEEIFYEVASLRLCASAFGLEPLPEGWWTGLELPDAFIEQVTALVITNAGTTTRVVNGGRRQTELVEWGLERFELAGLAAPVTDSVAFPPTRWCARGAGDYAGVAVFNGEQARVDMCLLEGEICIGPTCDTMRAEAKLGLLHELAHVWEHQNLDDHTRQAFLEERDLDVWSDPNPPWAPDETEEGIEHAADMIAWGLMDEELAMVRIPNITPEQLQAGFRLLTQVEPLINPSTP